MPKATRLKSCLIYFLGFVTLNKLPALSESQIHPLLHEGSATPWQGVRVQCGVSAKVPGLPT